MATAAGEYLRPSLSFAGLIIKALLSSAERKLSQGAIFAWIEHNYPFFRTIDGHVWRDQIRRVLSVNSCFYKVHSSIKRNACCWSVHAAAVHVGEPQAIYRRNHHRRNKHTPTAVVLDRPTLPARATDPAPPPGPILAPPQPLFTSPMHFAYFHTQLDGRRIHYLPPQHGSPTDWARGWGAILKQCITCLPWQDPLMNTSTDCIEQEATVI